MLRKVSTLLRKSGRPRTKAVAAAARNVPRRSSSIKSYSYPPNTLRKVTTKQAVGDGLCDPNQDLTALLCDDQEMNQDPLAALQEAVVAATAEVQRRSADTAAIKAFLLGRDPTMPEEPDDTTRLLWKKKEESGWTEEHLRDAKEDLRDAEQRLRDAKEHLRDAEQRLWYAEQRLRDAEQRRDAEAKGPLDVAKTIQYYKSKGGNTYWNTPPGELRSKTGHMCDFDRIADSVVHITTEIAQAQWGADKSNLPLPCVIGTAGQGKTEVLLAIMRDEGGIQQKMMDAYNKAYGYKAKKKPVVSTVLPLFASFNQSTTYEAGSREGHPCSSLIGRLLAHHFKAPWNAEDTPRLTADLPSVLEAVSREAGDNVLLVLLVDELRKLGNTDRSSLLNAICGALSKFNSTLTFHMIPIVSCLEVTALFTNVTTHSMRPLSPIPILPCPQKDIDVILQHAQPNAHVAMYIHMCGGHYRSIEQLLYQNIQSTPAYRVCVPDKLIPAVLSLLGMILLNPNHKVWRSEYDSYDGKTLWALVSATCGVIYKEVDTATNRVCPAIQPFALMNAGNCHPTAHPSMPLFKQLYSLLVPLQTHSKEVLIKNWEQAVPIAEALHCALTGTLPPYLAGLDKEEPWVKAPAKGDYGVTVHEYNGNREKQRRQLKEDLKGGQRGIYCPTLQNYPHIDVVHTIYGVAFLKQDKMNQYVKKGMLVNYAKNVIKEAPLLGLDKYIVVIYATGTNLKTLEGAARDLGGKPADVVMIGLPPYRSVYIKTKKVCFVCGDNVFDALEPLLGTVARYINDVATGKNVSV